MDTNLSIALRVDKNYVVTSMIIAAMDQHSVKSIRRPSLTGFTQELIKIDFFIEFESSHNKEKNSQRIQIV